MHVDAELAVAFARFAPPALGVEGKCPRGEPAHFGGGQRGKQLSDFREDTEIRHRIAARAAADRVLVHHHQLVEMLQPRDLPVPSRNVFCVIEPTGQGAPQDVVDKRAFAAAGDAGHAGEQADWETDSDGLEVVFLGGVQREMPGGQKCLTSPAAADSLVA